MTKHGRPTIAACAIVSFMAATVAAQKVSFDYDKSADFRSLNTFAFKKGTSSGNPLVDERIVTAIEGVLTSRGLTKAESNPDVIIVTHLTFEKKQDISAYSTSPGYGPYGWRWGGGWGMTDVRVREIPYGTLIIDMVDVKKDALIWRGMGVKEGKAQPKPEPVDKNVTEAVAKILRNFPPNQTTSSRGCGPRSQPAVTVTASCEAPAI